MNRLALLALCSGTLLACQSNRPGSEDSSGSAAEERPGAQASKEIGAQEASGETAAPSPLAAPALGEPERSSYGAALTEQPATRLEALLASPDEYAGKTVLVEGRVRRACSRKGCWLEIAKDASEGAACRVTFKDYGFFVPTDSAGALARVQGTVELTQVKRAQVEHLEGEGATFAHKNDDGTATEVRIVATGVELSRG